MNEKILGKKIDITKLKELPKPSKFYSDEGLFWTGRFLVCKFKEQRTNIRIGVSGTPQAYEVKMNIRKGEIAGVHEAIAHVLYVSPPSGWVSASSYNIEDDENFQKLLQMIGEVLI